MQERHSNMKLYFEELATTSRKFYIPYFTEFIPINSSTNILEIGCRDGGNLVPFAEIGCRIKGIDISEYFINHAIDFFKEKNISATFEVSDIFKLDISSNEKYDLIIVADVIEHISKKKELLAFVKHNLSSKGIVFFKFPAWQMPFGGHQQLCKNKFLSNLPYYHLLPKGLYKSVLKLFKEPQPIIDELLDIKSCKVSIEKFEKLSKKEGFVIKDKKLYFINPHYETKFNLKPRILYSLLGKIPYIRNFFTTSCFYILGLK